MCPKWFINCSRYLEFDPAEWSDSDSRFPNQPKTLVWTNIPLLWPMLQGAGATPTACNKNRGQYKTDAETGFEQKPTQLWKENEKRDLNSRRWKKRKLILTECPRVTRSMSTSCSKWAFIVACRPIFFSYFMFINKDLDQLHEWRRMKLTMKIKIKLLNKHFNSNKF